MQHLAADGGNGWGVGGVEDMAADGGNGWGVGGVEDMAADGVADLRSSALSVHPCPNPCRAIALLLFNCNG